MLDQTDRDALEAMVDRYNAHAVIAGLAEICLEKAAWVESPEKPMWQGTSPRRMPDHRLAWDWRRLAKMLDRPARIANEIRL